MAAEQVVTARHDKEIDLLLTPCQNQPGDHLTHSEQATVPDHAIRFQYAAETPG